MEELGSAIGLAERIDKAGVIVLLLLLLILSFLVIRFLWKRYEHQTNERFTDNQKIMGVADASKTTIQALTVRVEERSNLLQLTADAQRSSAEAQKTLAQNLDRVRQLAEQLAISMDRLHDALERNAQTHEQVRVRQEEHTRKLDDIISNRRGR